MQDRHRREFVAGVVAFGQRHPDLGVREPIEVEARARLRQAWPGLAPSTHKLDYRDDFGDNWHGQLVVEELLPADL